MKKIFLILISILTFENVFSQVNFFFEKHINEEVIVLIGPKNVDRFSPNQAEFYINKYEKLAKLVEEEISRLEVRLREINNKKVFNGNKVEEIERQLEAHYLETEIIQEFIASWISHNENYIRYSKIANSEIDSSKCFVLHSNENSYNKKDITIKSNKKDELIPHNEIINSSYFTHDIIFEEIDYEKYVKEEIRKTFEKEENKKYRLTGWPKPKGRMFRTSQEYIKLVSLFQYDEQQKVYFRELDVKAKADFNQIIDMQNDIEFIPIEYIELDCLDINEKN